MEFVCELQSLEVLFENITWPNYMQFLPVEATKNIITMNDACFRIVGVGYFMNELCIVTGLGDVATFAVPTLSSKIVCKPSNDGMHAIIGDQYLPARWIVDRAKRLGLVVKFNEVNS